MAVSVFKTFSVGEILTASDLNSSLTQITNNGTDVAFPLTKNGAAGGFKFTGMGAGSAAGESVRYEQLAESFPFGCQELRLTLTSGTPVTTTDVTAAGTIYLTPYKGKKIALYDGSAWVVRSTAEVSLALAGLMSITTPCDIFAFDSSGTVALQLTAWATGTARSTGLTYQDGILVANGSPTRRYIGTLLGSTVNLTEDSATKRFVWNYYNRVMKPMRAALESTDTWNYTTATIRQANANPVNQLNFVMGYGEDSVWAEAVTCAFNSTGGVVAAIGIGLDSTSAFTSGGIFAGVTTTTLALPVMASLVCYPGIGKHFLSWNEYSGAGVGTTTWRGDAGDAALAQAGIHGEILA